MDAQPGVSTLTTRQLDATDAPAMRSLFQNIFNKDMSAALWDWKYRRPQSGMESGAVGVFRDGALVCHYGGMGADIYYKGKAATAMQIVDVMVEPAVRGAVRKQSPFFLAGSAFLEQYIGFKQPYLLGYGFPSDRHLALAEHLQLYAPVGRMWELNWDLTAPPRQPLLQKVICVDAGNLAQHRAALNAVWGQLRADLGERIVVRKDAAFVEWRYLQHPQEQYTLLLLQRRFTGAPLGLCVLKQEAERVLLMDAIGALRHMPQLIRAAQAATWRGQCRKLATWCSAPDIARFGTDVTTTQPLPITTPANIWTVGPPPEELQDRWWLMPGDTDSL